MISFEKIDYSTDEFATFYDELPLWSAPFGLLLLQYVPLRTGMRVLDVGAGTGFLSIELAQRCSSDSEIVALDPWSAALSRLRAKVERLGIQNVSLVEASIESADLVPESFDLVVSNLGLNNFADPLASMRACCRALRPDGQLFVCTNTRDHMSEFYAEYRSTLIDLGLDDSLGRLDAHIAHRPTLEALSLLLKESGFVVSDTHTDSFTMGFANGPALLRHHFIRLGFLPEWAEICPEERQQEVFRHLEDRLNRLAAEQGVLSLSVPMLCVEAVKAGYNRVA